MEDVYGEGMKHVTLLRYIQNDYSTFGVLKIEGVEDPIFWTIERPWKNNENKVSCFPEGVYQCFYREDSKNAFTRDGVKYGVYELKDVPNRTHCQLHVGNYVEDVIGCVAVGLGAGYAGQKRMVTHSREAMIKLINLLGKDDFVLTVIGGSI